MGEERAAIVTKLLHSIALSSPFLPPSPSIFLPLSPPPCSHPTILSLPPLSHVPLPPSFSFLPLPHRSSSSLLLLLLPPSPQITSGEYIQMSGRAGRRGLDERGIVMLMVDERMDSTVGKGLLRVHLSSHMSLLQVLHTPYIHVVCVYVCVCTQHAPHYMYTIHTCMYASSLSHMYTCPQNIYNNHCTSIQSPPLPIPLHPTHTHIYTPRVVQTL